MQNHEDFKAILPAPAAIISLLHYYAPWSLPCRRQCLVLHEFLRNCRQPPQIVPIDVEIFSRMAESTTIQSIPTIIILSHGRERRRLVGLQPLEVLQQVTAEAAKAAVFL